MESHLMSTNINLIRFDLLENAKDSLSHAVEHLINDGSQPSAGDYKRAISDLFHEVELLLKERVKRIHPAFLWKKVEEFGDLDKQTIGVDDAVKRLLVIGKIKLSEKSESTIKRCKRIRNSIEHHSFEISSKEANAIIGSILSFIFIFSENHLNLDLESDFRKDDRWQCLTEIYEFFDEHSKAIETRLSENHVWALDCPYCGAITFNTNEAACEMCDHRDTLMECYSCQETCFESESEVVEGFDETDDNYGPQSYIICRNCFKSQSDEAHAIDAMAASHEEK